MEDNHGDITLDKKSKILLDLQMTAPSTPSLTAQSPTLGPQGPLARKRGGSVSGGPWQLIEVSSAKEAKTISQANTPLIKAQRSPLLHSAGAPADLEEFNIDEKKEEPGEAQAFFLAEHGKAEEEPTHKGKGKGKQRLEEKWVEYEAGKGKQWVEDEEEVDPNAFNAKYLIGDWTDNLGHRVLVTPTEPSGRQRDRRSRRNKGGGKGGQQMRFLVVMQKFGMPDKRFNINKDPKGDGWTCGNGVLDRDESGAETIVWKTTDGRVNKWERTPPEGVVYFDPPPPTAGMEEAWMAAHGVGPAYFAMPGYMGEGPPQGEWHDLHLPPDNEEPSQPQQSGSDGGEPAEGEVGAQDADPVASQWNLAAPTFVMPTPQAAVAPAPATPGMKPVAPPGPVGGVQALACQLKLSEESPDVTIIGNRLEWALPDDWGKLSRFPKDFCLTSPMFGVPQASNMQLVFYPNGSRTAEAGRCTVALTRGPESAGIKFEFSVNGRGSGPKVCLGRRYLGDYPKPHDDAEETKTKKVVVCMQVLEVLGI